MLDLEYPTPTLERRLGEWSKLIERYRPESIAKRERLPAVIENNAGDKWLAGNFTQSAQALEVAGLHAGSGLDFNAYQLA